MPPSLSQLAGKIISHVWCGDYSALYLELGELSAARRYGNGASGNTCGEITLYAGFDWRFSGPWASFASDDLSAGRRQVVISSLLQAKVESARLSGNGVELSIALANGVRLTTHSPNPLEPNWSLSFNADNPGHLYIQNGVLRVDHAGS